MKEALGMRSLFKRRLQLQLLFILLAAVLVASLSVLLISDAVESAEGVVLADAGRTLTAAVSELNQQYQDRVTADSVWQTLPVPAQDTSLRGVSQAVLRSYPGVEGGYYDGAHFLGYSYPTHDTGGNKSDVPTAELDDILAAISQSRAVGTAQRTLRGQQDIVVIEAKSDGRNGLASWTMKRLSGRSDPGSHRREILLSALVLAALISIAGTLATGVLLQRGIVQIKSGLSALQSDFSHRLPERNDELGEISHSINRMAEARQKLETELRREDRLRAVGRLVAGIAHEIRNPLNSIRLNIEYMERRLGGDSVRAEDLRPSPRPGFQPCPAHAAGQGCCRPGNHYSAFVCGRGLRALGSGSRRWQSATRTVGATEIAERRREAVGAEDRRGQDQSRRSVQAHRPIV